MRRPPRPAHGSAGASPTRFCAALAILLWAAAAGAQGPSEKTLSECLAMALDHHPSLKAAGAAVDAAHQRVWQAASGYLPQINAAYSLDRSMTSLGASTGTDVDPQSSTFTFHETGASFSQRLFDFGKTLADIRGAQASQRSVDADRATQRETVVLSVKQSYYQLLAAQRLRVVAEDTVRQNRAQTALAEGRNQVGLAPRFDVTRARVQLAQAELDQLTARNNVQLARETLRNAIGLTAPLDFDIVDTLEAARVQIGETQALQTAYDSRPELASILAQQNAVEQQVASLQRDYLPYVTGNGGYFWSGTWNGSEVPYEDSWNIGAAVNLSLFNGGLTTAQVGEAKANLSRLRYDEDTLRQNIALAVRQALLNAQQASESIGVAEKGAQEARESLELAEGRYETGVGNIIELTDAQTARTSAEARAVQALYDYQTSLAELERAMGQALAREP
ncbi:MAG: TolC family protein [Candidatus Binatia bacterium]